MSTNLAIAYRPWQSTGAIFYVREKPGEDGVDWGYTPDARKARPLSRYWQRRFAADCRRVSMTAHFIPVNSPNTRPEPATTEIPPT